MRGPKGLVRRNKQFTSVDVIRFSTSHSQLSNTTQRENENVEAIIPGEGVGSLQTDADLPRGGATRPPRVLRHQPGGAPDAQRDGKGGGIGTKVCKFSAILNVRSTLCGG